MPSNVQSEDDDEYDDEDEYDEEDEGEGSQTIDDSQNQGNFAVRLDQSKINNTRRNPQQQLQ
jgi:hypothetical protein